MIVPAIDIPPADFIRAAESLGKYSNPKQLASSEKPKEGIKTTFTFPKRILQIEPGRLQLRLTASPEVEVDPSGLMCEVVDWGVRLPTRQVEQLPSAMARRFLELFSKADQGRLEESEEMEWIRVLERVDFQDFCIARAQPHYMEGELIARQHRTVRVEWHDGCRETLGSSASRALAHLAVGDCFGAWVKLGKDNEPISIENVSILPSSCG